MGFDNENRNHAADSGDDRIGNPITFRLGSDLNTLVYDDGSANYVFDGPYVSFEDLKEQSGVVLILSNNNQKLEFIDALTASDLKNHVRNQEWLEEWTGRYNGGLLVFAAYYSNDREKCRDIREDIKKKLESDG